VIVYKLVMLNGNWITGNWI